MNIKLKKQVNLIEVFLVIINNELQIIEIIHVIKN